jgi:hypothetical protein
LLSFRQGDPVDDYARHRSHAKPTMALMITIQTTSTKMSVIANLF